MSSDKKPDLNKILPDVTPGTRDLMDRLLRSVVEQKPRELDFEYMRLIATTNDINYDQKTGKFTGLSGDRVLLKCSLDAYAVLKKENFQLKSRLENINGFGLTDANIKIEELKRALSEMDKAFANKNLEAVELRTQLEKAKAPECDEPHNQILHKNKSFKETGYIEGCSRCEWLQTNLPLRDVYMNATNRIVELEAEAAEWKTKHEKLEQYADEQIKNIDRSRAKAIRERDAARAEVHLLTLQMNGYTQACRVRDELREELDAALQNCAGLLEALERLTKVGPPSRSCNGDEIFQVQIQDNCNIARDAINKFGGKGDEK